MAFIRRSKSPELPVILLEDLGALFGLIFALFGVTMAVVTGDGVWDAIGTLMIGVLLAVISVILAVETKSLLLGEGRLGGDGEPDPRRAGGHARGRPRHPHAHAAPGPGGAAGGGEDRGDPQRHGRRGGPGIDEAERRIREAVPIARVIYLEPDLDRTPSNA